MEQLFSRGAASRAGYIKGWIGHHVLAENSRADLKLEIEESFFYITQQCVSQLRVLFAVCDNLHL